MPSESPASAALEKGRRAREARAAAQLAQLQAHREAQATLAQRVWRGHRTRLLRREAEFQTPYATRLQRVWRVKHSRSVVQAGTMTTPRVGGTVKYGTFDYHWTGGGLRPDTIMAAPRTMKAFRPSDWKGQVKMEESCTAGLPASHHLSTPDKVCLLYTSPSPRD